VKLPSHEATTAQLGALYPFVASRALPTGGVVVGRDLYGGVFAHDPFELYASGAVTNPNMIVLGQIGRGKSAFIKTYLFRQAAFGRRVVVLDPKGEYGPLARALGSEPIRLSPGGGVRLNPLGVVGVGDAEEVRRKRLELLVGITSSSLARALHPVEHAALELALNDSCRSSSVPTLPLVIERLLAPSAVSARSIASEVQTLRDDARDVALELRRLVFGEWCGMFDGLSTEGVDLQASVVVLDLSAVYHSPALGALMVCAAGSLEATWRKNASVQTIFVVDEAWAVLSNVGAARFLQSSWKLARSQGVANVAVIHRLSDLSAAGDQGSVVTRLAEGLLADCESLVCYAQHSSELERIADLFDFDDVQARLLTRLQRSVALWRVGSRSFLVEHRLAPIERAIVDTDAHLRRAPRTGPERY
jgi:hypothetical protein